MATERMEAANRYRWPAALVGAFLLSLAFVPLYASAAFGDGVYGGGIYNGSIGSGVPGGGGGACVNCAGGGSPAAGNTTSTTTSSMASSTTSSSAVTATTSSDGASSSTPFRCAETGTATDGLSAAGLVNLFVSLGIIPTGKAKTACDALTGEVDSPAIGAASSFRFTVPLRKGERSDEVRRLQQFLNAHSFVLTSGTDLGAPGHETDLFGLLTFDAVKRFQGAYTAEILTPVGLTAPSGFFGPSSIKKANALLVGA